jgi:hypothetical protein
MKLDIGTKNTQLYNTVLQQETNVCTNVQLQCRYPTNACARFYLYALCDVLLMHSEITKLQQD